MSTEAVQWAIEEARSPGHLFAVLVCLAWKADEEGRGAFPSEATLAGWTGKTERSVRSDLRALEITGLIRPGNQELVAHLRADRRPSVWDLAMPAVPRESTGGSTRPVVSFRAEVHDRSSASGRDTARPEVQRHHGRKPASANKSLIEKPPETSSSRKRDEYADPLFAEFWETYPRKAGKRAGWKAWQAAVKRGADPAAITKAAARYAGERAGTDPRYTAHPATWLNQGRYDDEDQPALPAEREFDWTR